MREGLARQLRPDRSRLSAMGIDQASFCCDNSNVDTDNIFGKTMNHSSPGGFPMTIGTQLHRARLSSHYDTIVIGSGLGGLSAACILAKAGHKVLVLERHYTAGGFTHTFKRKGYEWDVGVHYIGDVHRPHTAIRRMFDYITDGKLQWAKMPPVYDTIYLGYESFDFVEGEKAFLAQMLIAFPKEEAALKSYLKLIKDVTRSAGSHYALKICPASLAQILTPFVTRFFGSYAQQTTRDVLESLTRDKKLQAVLAGQWGDYGLPPGQSSFAMHAMVAKHYLNGASYPVGGASRIGESIAEVIAQHGGEIVTSAEVEEILCQGQKAIGVRLAKGTSLSAKRVLSAVGARNTFLRLLPRQHPTRSDYEERLPALPASLAHVCLYLGLKSDLADLKVPSSNLWIYQDENHDKVLKSLDGEYSGKFPLVYISFPSAKDPTWSERYPGKSTIEMVVPAPFHWFKKWQDKPWQKRGHDYQDLKSDMTQKLLEILFEKLPQLRDKIHYTELSTPLSTRHFSNYQGGEIYGLVHTPNRFSQSWLRADTPIRNLFLTGQDIVTCGIGGALTAGALSALRILGPFRGRHLWRLF